MLSGLRRAIRNYVLQTIGAEEINSMLTNGFDETDKQILMDILKADGS